MLFVLILSLSFFRGESYVLFMSVHNKTTESIHPTVTAIKDEFCFSRKQFIFSSNCYFVDFVLHQLFYI